MRGTIIGVFAVVVLIVSVLSFALMRLSLGDISNKGEAQRAVTAAVAQLQVEGLRIERWLAIQASAEGPRAVYSASTAPARADAATNAANAIEEAAKQAGQAGVIPTIKPSLVALFDTKGVVLGRNGSTLMRREKLGERHPFMLTTILAGNTGSAVWVNKAHSEQFLASFAPVRAPGGEIIGGVAVGMPFNDGRLKNASEATGKSALLAAVPAGDGLEMVARSGKVTDEMVSATLASKRLLESTQTALLSGLSEAYEGAARPLDGYGNGQQALVVAVAPARVVGSFGSLIWGLLGALVFGLILTVICAHLIDAYISQPVEDLEEGLLAIINGQNDIRFELEHKVLGGLVFRINSLLNQLLGVSEDDTDDQGRPSHAPSSQSFGAALNVDERMVSVPVGEVEDAEKLRAEPPEDYYKRIFDEYIAAKRSVGDPVDHIKFAPFSQRLRASEAQLSEKHGKQFRYRIEVKGKEIVLLAVPIA